MSHSSRSNEAEWFDLLAECSDAERAAQLAQLRHRDPPLAARLERLLRAANRAGDFLGVLGPRGAPHSPEAHTPATVGQRVQPGVGDEVGPFRLVRELGRGGSGVVWLAVDRRLDRPVALKVLSRSARRAPQRGVTRDAETERFLVEARAAAALDHPHVATVYEVGFDAEDHPFLAMAYYEGGSLADRVARGPLSFADAQRIAWQVASALEAAHTRGIVHRDVKPANVLFDASGQVRLADFGIARFHDQSLTDAGVVLGTLAYLSPERVRGATGAVGSDLWALGVTLYEMLAGERPFTATSPSELLRRIEHGQMTGLQSLRPDTPAPLLDLVHSLLAPQPEERPPSAAAVLARLAAQPAPSDTAAQFSAEARHAPPVVAALNDPGPGPSLIGREGELATALGLLGGTRLLTLTGPGGTGKTRLAQELARRASAWFGGRVQVVALASVRESARVPDAVARALGMRDPLETDAARHIAGHLGSQASLLVLDNFEQVRDAAPFVAELLEAAPRLTVVVTSREPLRLRAEQELPIPPLTVPTSGDLSHIARADAVRLFVQRARSCRPDFVLDARNADDVASLCRRLDGLPLAIELAAARIRHFTPRALVARLALGLDLLRSDARDMEPRHRTLRDVLAWSHALLSSEEQRVFAELGVFAGSFSLDGASAVAFSAADAQGWEIVASLSDKSLLTRHDTADGETRYVMLETVREFAREQLLAAGDGELVQRRHAQWMAHIADDIGDQSGGPARLEAMERVQRELDDMLVALAWCLDGDRGITEALRIVGGLTMFWHWSGRWREGREWAERAIAAFDRQATAPTFKSREALARSLQAAHLLSWSLGEPELALRHAQRARALWTTLEVEAEDTESQARLRQWATYTACVSAFSYLAHGQPERAQQVADEGMALAQQHGGEWIRGFASGWRALLRITMGASDAATQDLADAHQHLGAVGDTWTLSWCCTQAATAALSAGDPLSAAQHATTGLALLQDATDWTALAHALELMATAGLAWQAQQGHGDAGVSAPLLSECVLLLGAADAIREQHHRVARRADRLSIDQALRDLRQRLGEARFADAWQRGRMLTPESLPAQAARAAQSVPRWPQGAGYFDGRML